MQRTMEQISATLQANDPRIAALLTGNVTEFPTIVRALLKLQERNTLLDLLPEGAGEPEEGREFFFLYPCSFRGLCARWYTKEELDVAIAAFDKWLSIGKRYARLIDIAKQIESEVK